MSTDLTDQLNAALSSAYAVERELGRGGMATVYLARDHKHDRPVALKVLDADVAAVADCERFLREIRIAARLQHPHIVPLYDSGEASGLRYFVMPLIDGPSLRERLAEAGRLPLEEVLRIVEQVASALDYAHASGIVHRDIKPENILISRGNALVADFGIARPLAEVGTGSTMTAAGVAVGTPTYMSPEQAAGPGAVDGRSDQYALACVAYELLSGKPPFTGPTAQAVIAQHVVTPVPAVDLGPGIASAALSEVLAQALAKEPPARFGTVSEFAAALRAASIRPPARELPVELTSFVGRTREIEELQRLLPSTRLLTLTGAGGSGKTRLALEMVSRVRDQYADGVVWVELAPLDAPELLNAHVAAAVHVREGRLPTIEALVEALRDQSLLLVLDNCEHLVEACAALASTLLRDCARLRILATSREALGIGAERAWLVPTLALPPESMRDQEALATSESVRLFVDRAQSASASFELSPATGAAVARICRRLEGLPLAIELAAARVRVLTPEQIAGRLDDSFGLLTSRSRGVPTRHQTLRAAVDWSYQLLSQPERVLLQRLSVFAGGFTLEAIEAVCSDEDIDAAEVLDLVAALVDKSLVTMHERADAATYSLLESVRQYAAERLDAEGDVDRLRARHADFFLAWLDSIEPKVFYGGGSPELYARLETELPNLRAASDWFAAESDRADKLLRLETALQWLWVHRGRFREGRDRLTTALARSVTAPPLSRARALTALALTAFSAGDMTACRDASAKAVDLLRNLDEPGELAHALMLLGAALSSSDAAASSAIGDEAIALARQHKREVLPTALALRATKAFERGEVDLARGLWEEGAAEASSRGLMSTWHHINDALGRVAYGEGDYERARAAFRASVASPAVANAADPLSVAIAVAGGAAVAALDGDFRRAARLGAAAAAIRERIGHLRPDERAFHEAVASRARAALGDDAFADASIEGGALTLDRALEEARAATAFVGVAERPVETAPSSESPALAVRTLGGLEIRLGGAVVPRGAWRYSKPRELLLYLMSYPDGRTREQVGLALWPEASTAQVRNTFHVTLHHLRKVVGRAVSVQVEEGRYRIAPEPRVEYDAVLFESTVVRCLRAARRKATPIEELRSAIALYRGDFLDGESFGDWTVEVRDRLRQLYIDALDGLGSALLDAGRWDEAVEVYRRLVREENLRESAHRQLMVALSQLGDRASALDHYRRLVELLRAELGTRPDAQTSALYQRLQQ